MRIFRVNQNQMHEIKEHNSQGGYISPIVEVMTGSSIHWLWFDPHSNIGLHKTEGPLMYIIVEGKGWAGGEQIEPMPIKSGDYVFWDTREWCEVGSETGMQAIAIESRRPEFDAFKIP